MTTTLMEHQFSEVRPESADELDLGVVVVYLVLTYLSHYMGKVMSQIVMLHNHCSGDVLSGSAAGAKALVQACWKLCRMPFTGPLNTAVVAVTPCSVPAQSQQHSHQLHSQPCVTS